MLRNRLQGRASQTLVGLGRLLLQLSGEDGLVSQLQLQQALRAFHISLTPEVRTYINIKLKLHEKVLINALQIYMESCTCIFML